MTDRLGTGRAGPPPPPLPTGTRLIADPSLERREEGRLLAGGSPLRFLRLSSAGADLVGSWLDQASPVGAGAGGQRLARRLIDAGMAHPDPPPLVHRPEVSIVIPVRDDQVGLEATLKALGPGWPVVVVVDDASAVPVHLPDNVGSVRLVRRHAAGGPGVARQDGWQLAPTTLVGFVDAGVEITGEDLARLCRWFEDPTMVAVGPRTACRPGADLVARYEQRRSPLDLGPMPSPVGPGRPVAYLPTTCLVVRGEALAAADGFDPGLRYGEDVDLVWRLLDLGSVRYDPSVVALHPARSTVGALARQRSAYGSSAAPLAARHGSRVAPVRMSGWSLACWGLAAAGQPVLGLLVAGGTAAALVRKLAPVLGPDRRDAIGLTFRGHWAAGGSLADASVREWWPVTALTAVAGRRRVAVALVTLAAFRRFRSGPRRPLPAAALDLGLGAIDNVAYGAGVWRGAWRQRSARSLLPDLVSWPGRSGRSGRSDGDQP